MESAEYKYFEKLKDAIVRKMQQSHPEAPALISDWKGQHILAFQIELREQQNGNISEKWFYTHMKSGSDKLPRIDTLNLLSRYAGYKSWDHFVYSHRSPIERSENRKDSSNRLFIIIPSMVAAVTLLFYLAVSTIYNQEYSFCFVDSDTGESIIDRDIVVGVLIDGESPDFYTCNQSGCFSIKHNHKTLSFVVETPNYQSDTIVRRLNKFSRDEIVRLRRAE